MCTTKLVNFEKTSSGPQNHPRAITQLSTSSVDIAFCGRTLLILMEADDEEEEVFLFRSRAIGLEPVKKNCDDLILDMFLTTTKKKILMIRKRDFDFVKMNRHQKEKRIYIILVRWERATQKKI